MKHLFLKLLIPSFFVVAAETSANEIHQDVPPVTLPAKENTPFIEYHNRIAAFNMLATYFLYYERIKPNAIYVGIEELSTEPFLNHSASSISLHNFSMGYNFFWNGRDHFTPIAGIGYFRARSKSCYYNTLFRSVHHEEFSLLYGTLGILYDHEFNTIFNLGLNLKVDVGGQLGHRKKHDIGTPCVGIDVSIPITFRFGYRRHWDIRIEPFDIFWFGKKHSHNYLSTKGSVGYRF